VNFHDLSSLKGSRNPATRDITSAISSGTYQRISEDKAQATAELNEIVDFYDMGKPSDDKGRAVINLKEIVDFYGVGKLHNKEATRARPDIIVSSRDILVYIPPEVTSAIAELRKIVSLNNVSANRNPATRDITSAISSGACHGIPEDKAQATAELKEIADFYDIDKLPDDKARAITKLREILDLCDKAATRDISWSGSCMQISDGQGKFGDDSAMVVPFLFRCSCGFSPNTETGLKVHLDQFSNRPGHKRVQVRFIDSDSETEEWLPDEVPSAVAVPRCEQTILQDGAQQMQKTVMQKTVSRDTVRSAVLVKEQMRETVASDQTEVEDHIVKARRWLERNKAARIQEKIASSADHIVNPEVAPPWEELSKSQRWLEQNKAARIQKKMASPGEKFDEHTLQKHHVDPEVATWLKHLHKSLGLVSICQRRNISTLATTNNKLEKTFEKVRNYRELRPGLWQDSCSRAKLKRGNWKSQADVKAAQIARKEAAILLTSGIERVYGSTMLGFSRE